MKHTFTYALVILLSLICSNIIWGQDRTIDKIEMLYDQGNYSKVYRKTNKLQKDAKYQNSAPIKLFEALASYQLAQTKSKYSEKQAIEAYRIFAAWDTIGEYRLTYNIYIYDLQIGWVNKIRKLEKQGKSAEAKAAFQAYTELFQHQVSYDELTATQPNVSTPTPTNQPDETEQITTDNAANSIKKQQKAILKEANKHLGTPYKYGGITPKGFDCSGFTQYVMAKNGIQIPRTSKAQAVSHKKVKQKDARIGDLVFFGSSKSNISHVGIVSKVEGSQLYMIHASTSKGIMITEITTNVYWSKKVQFITRVIQ
ncbi:MAG: C40 family peptidase [Flavobacteriales bacterium]|jgi:cell wall-associated NlpC family hydrolase|nr:C40 family peptidase [Flavobacteriales bacterium]